jgi:hypothetical protein
MELRTIGCNDDNRIHIFKIVTLEGLVYMEIILGVHKMLRNYQLLAKDLEHLTLFQGIISGETRLKINTVMATANVEVRMQVIETNTVLFTTDFQHNVGKGTAVSKT